MPWWERGLWLNQESDVWATAVSIWTLPWASLIVQLIKNLPAIQETPVRFLGGKIPWRRDRLPTPVFLGFPDSSAGKNLPPMWKTWAQSLGREDALEKEKATHSRILAWRIPWVTKSRTRLSDSHLLSDLMQRTPWSLMKSVSFNTLEVKQALLSLPASSSHSWKQAWTATCGSWFKLYLMEL